MLEPFGSNQRVYKVAKQAERQQSAEEVACVHLFIHPVDCQGEAPGRHEQQHNDGDVEEIHGRGSLGGALGCRYTELC
jgi:hypothetical protein